ncbi:MAG: class II glutamine amidotransferase [Deltaproteobacteria bacterium]|nr:class II glutamine amidotransferase [Deltaproteobacteria bacterium]
MCRMLAFASEDPRDLAPYLAHLARLSAHGNLVDRWEKRPGGNHPDGWGIAFHREGETSLFRSGMPASTDPSLAGFQGVTDCFLGHARYASNTETVDAGNAHPFLLRGIALAHNGTFRGRIGEEADRRMVSDTLVFLEALAERWKERTHPGLCETLSRLLGDAELVGAYSAATMLIASGKTIFALRNYRKDEDYYTLFARVGPDQVVVASEPLDDSPGWRLLANGELLELCLPAPKSLFLTAAV